LGNINFESTTTSFTSSASVSSLTRETAMKWFYAITPVDLLPSSEQEAEKMALAKLGNINGRGAVKLFTRNFHGELHLRTLFPAWRWALIKFPKRILSSVCPDTQVGHPLYLIRPRNLPRAQGELFRKTYSCAKTLS
jgi:hypothetical protein